MTGVQTCALPIFHDGVQVVPLPGLECLRDHRELAARQPEVELVEQPCTGLRLAAHPAGFDTGFQHFGVAETTHRQGRRSQPHQLQQRVGRDRRDRGANAGHGSAGSVLVVVVVVVVTARPVPMDRREPGCGSLLMPMPMPMPMPRPVPMLVMVMEMR